MRGAPADNPKPELPYDPSSTPIEAVLGLEVAKNTVTLHDLASRQTPTVVHTHAALSAALESFGDHQLAVCETTGGLQRSLEGRNIKIFPLGSRPSFPLAAQKHQAAL